MATNLITRAEYKAYAGLNSTNQDAQIDLLITKISELVKTYCRRTFIDFYDEAKTEVFQGGFKTLLLKETPVVNIVSVNYSADYGQTFTKLTKFTDWVQDGDSIMAINPNGFTQQINGYKVVYFAGYETVPADLTLAAMDLVTYYRNHDVSVHSTKTPGSNQVQIEYISTTSLPAHIKRILDLYAADYT
jgi:hypothetical protein